MPHSPGVTTMTPSLAYKTCRKACKQQPGQASNHTRCACDRQVHETFYKVDSVLCNYTPAKGPTP
jgi:hypothetical protein